MIARAVGLTTAVVVAGLLSAGCARESARADVPEHLSGTYTFVGADTAAKIPWAARVDLTLKDDSTFQLELRIRVKDEDEQDVKAGTYRVERDRLVLMGSGQEREDVEFRIRGDSLVMDAGWVAMAALRFIGVPRPILVKAH